MCKHVVLGDGSFSWVWRMMSRAALRRDRRPLHPLYTDRADGSLQLLGVFAGLMLVWVVQVPALAAESDTGWRRQGRNPHCGIECVYAAVLKFGNNAVEFSNFIKPKYIGSREGSSLAELMLAAKDHGLQAVPIQGLTSGELRATAYPIILHVRNDEETRDPNHWVLYLGEQDGLAKIFNPPGPISLVPFYELVPAWDGIGLIVSNSGIDTWALFGPVRKRFAIGVIAVVIVIGLAKWFSYGSRAIKNTTRRWSSPIQCSLEAAVLIGLAVGCALVYHVTTNEGLLARPRAVASIVKANLGSIVSTVSQSQVRQFIGRKDVVFVDARMRNDFIYGHLDGAINVPANAGPKQRLDAMTSVPKNNHVVIYCQSRGCPFAGKVAAHLLADGYQNISIFKGGWQDWVSEKQQ